MSTIAERILAKASRPGGASASELTTSMFDAVIRPQARQRMHELLVSGHLMLFTRAPVGGRGRDAEQYFTDPEHGRKWASCTAPALRPQSEAKRHRVKAAYKPVALTISKRRDDVKASATSGPVIVPLGLKVKVLPGMPAVDPRYQVDPSTRVVGGFASLGPGRYLEDAR